ncbi:MAG: DnaJ domain-containing protein [Dokdonella sp.]
MAAPVDFLRLYQELNLSSGASLEELKRAYRRRVSELHPDRLAQSDVAAARRAAERLQDLTVLYGAATEFHVRHGRLPGGVAPRRAAFETPPPPSSAVSAPAPVRRSLRGALLGIGLLILCAWMFWVAQYPEDDAASSEPETIAEPATAVAPLRPPVREPALPALDFGMLKRDVLALQGEPLIRGDDRWEYGPSWISFDKGKVSDWYSSPLRPLRHASQNPPPRKEIR